MGGQQCTPCNCEVTTYYVEFESDSDINVTLDHDEVFNTTLDMVIERSSGSKYIAGNGITIINRVISLDDLIIDCGTSNTVIFGGE